VCYQKATSIIENIGCIRGATGYENNQMLEYRVCYTYNK
jgi:hypothetical protein